MLLKILSLSPNCLPLARTLVVIAHRVAVHRISVTANITGLKGH